MKNLFLGFLAIVFISMSSFTSVNNDEIIVHNCTYRMYNASGQYLGNWTLYDVPDNISCGSSTAKQVAIDSYNAFH